MFGVWAPGEDVAKLAYYGLYALQHRGQESAGIAVSDGHRIMVHKEMGLVAQVFDEPALTALRVTSRSATAGIRPPGPRCGPTRSRPSAPRPPPAWPSGTTGT